MNKSLEHLEQLLYQYNMALFDPDGLERAVSTGKEILETYNVIPSQTVNTVIKENSRLKRRIAELETQKLELQGSLLICPSLN